MASKDIEAHTEAPLSDDNLTELKSNIDEHKNVGTLERRLKSRHVQFLAL